MVLIIYHLERRRLPWENGRAWHDRLASNKDIEKQKEGAWVIIVSMCIGGNSVISLLHFLL
jgi:hypothetical protein